MNPIYLPTSEIVQEHLKYLQETAHKPGWHGVEFSKFLLLGLRDPEVDQRLIQIAPKICLDNGSPTDIHSRDLIRLAKDPSVERVVRLVTRYFGEVSLAWFTPTQSEVLELVTRLGTNLANQSKPGRRGPALLATLQRFIKRNRTGDESLLWCRTPVVFASLCDLVSRFGNTEALALVRQLRPTCWLEQASWQRTCHELAVSATLTEELAPAWLPALPPALIRDPLTGLLNRAVLCDDPHRYPLPDGRTYSGRLPAPGVIMLDIDWMKRLNDQYGFRAGDTVLRELAQRLQKLVGDRAIRVGGDEQMILLESEANLGTVAQAVLEAVRSMTVPVPDGPGETVSITVSAGVASGWNTAEVLQAADEALYRAKCAGRDCVEVA